MNMLDVVALRDDLLDEGLRAGQVGTIVEEWQPGVYEVEFADRSGVAYAMVALRAEQLIRLRWSREGEDTRVSA